MAPGKAKDTDTLEDIKRLLILLLLKLGSDSGEIGEALDVDSSVIRKMMPTSNHETATVMLAEKDD